MTAFVILTREKTRNEKELAVYRSLVPSSLAGYEATFLVRHGHHEVLEGAATEDVMLASFPTLDAAMARYQSPAYSPACIHRFQGGDFRCIVVEGT